MGIEEIRVGIGEYKSSPVPSKIVTIGLGSCVGIALYDSNKKIGGLAHIMLPDSTQFQNNNKPGKFANLAIPLLLKEMESLGANPRYITGKIGGGASMFNFSEKGLVMDIGNRNVKAVIEAMKRLSIPIKGQDTGGSHGRTMILDVETGKTYIRAVGQEVKEI
ncbi:chemoreceptor glutamine deamidase CheD [Oxobacter pfennigii]|uniref:Probable chemoreceptor glutamine deamidase CheD n=1 Tax=Oxobacter pfennigii TaxID=36849 RepID=A0A0P9AGT0_9CLOT|nr:chemotaxis protein CheD [Oxobacter pfennigii]KPU44650.1 chemoreceptor glutamine deamidase CheD [Oxobacter pfennigii]